MYKRQVTPSTQRQFDMGRLLVEELHGLRIENAVLDEKCYVDVYKRQVAP